MIVRFSIILELVKDYSLVSAGSLCRFHKQLLRRLWRTWLPRLFLMILDRIVDETNIYFLSQ